ncbi:di-heme enzyme [Ottowia testudinis]|uniref:Di-heme enzyme n=2 Tax=Ottowia testudinis TaxID=2816950 RepID=A0A975H7X1_9BURK|nr:di-heme enzyme [Ottowia testudinis]
MPRLLRNRGAFRLLAPSPVGGGSGWEQQPTPRTATLRKRSGAVPIPAFPQRGKEEGQARWRGTRNGWLGAAALAAGLAACGGGDAPAPAPTTPAKTAQPTVLNWTYPAYTPPSDWQWDLPAHFPPPRVPADNPMSAAKVDLGRHLFYDKRLSGNGSMACASCHHQAKAFTDGRPRAIGATGVEHVRGAMALVNVAYNATYTWANPALASLERQIPNPLFGTTPVEMGVDEAAAAAIPARLKNATDVDYPAKFKAAFPDAAGDAVTWDHILKAITTFERTLISANSRYDQHLQGRAALTPQELNGLRLFKAADCIKCHAEPNFSGQFVSAATTSLAVRFHNKGLYNVGGTGDDPADSQGAVEITSNLADMGAFKAPTLRNIEVTAPYTHDGSIATLEEAVRIFTSGGRNVTSGPNAGDGRANPHKSGHIKDRAMSAQEQADLVAFLKTLTDHEFLTNPRLSDPFGAKP